MVMAAFANADIAGDFPHSKSAEGTSGEVYQKADVKAEVEA